MDNTASLLTDPHPCRHIVYPCNDEDKAIYAVSVFASSGLSKGESVVLFVADTRSQLILESLSSKRDMSTPTASGQLECLSADETLQSFLRNGELDGELARGTITEVIRRARRNSPSGRVRVFGEIVSLLLAQNRLEEAERLEEVWNEVIAAESISLLCTYTLLDSGFRVLPDSLGRLHSHDLGAVSANSNANSWASSS